MKINPLESNKMPICPKCANSLTSAYETQLVNLNTLLGFSPNLEIELTCGCGFKGFYIWRQFVDEYGVAKEMSWELKSD